MKMIANKIIQKHIAAISNNLQLLDSEKKKILTTYSIPIVQILTKTKNLDPVKILKFLTGEIALGDVCEKTQEEFLKIQHLELRNKLQVVGCLEIKLCLFEATYFIKKQLADVLKSLIKPDKFRLGSESSVNTRSKLDCLLSELQNILRVNQSENYDDKLAFLVRIIRYDLVWSILNLTKFDNKVYLDNKERQINFLVSNLDPVDRTYFKYLLSVPQINLSNGSKTCSFVLGDGDGSLPRLILLAIQSGHMILNDKELNLLKDLLIEEARLINIVSDQQFTRSLINYQEDKIIYEKLLNIVLAATYVHDVPHAYYSLGDIVFDRLTNNKVAVMLIINALSSIGCIFIRGNHDVYRHVDFIFNPTNKLQFGNNPDTDVPVNFKLLADDWSNFEKKFVNCAYSDAGLFFIHNGLKYINLTSDRHNNLFHTYQTAFGMISVPVENGTETNRSPAVHKRSVMMDWQQNKQAMEIVTNIYEPILNLSKKINELQSYNNEGDEQARKLLTNFRPKDDEVNLGPLFFVDIKVVHGHNESFNVINFDINNQIVNLNSRSSNGKIQPIATVFIDN